MVFHESASGLNTIFMWEESHGISPALRLIMHLDYNCIIDRNSFMTNQKGKRIYEKYYKVTPTNLSSTARYDKHKIVLFWRNPYYYAGYLYLNFIKQHNITEKHGMAQHFKSFFLINNELSRSINELKNAICSWNLITRNTKNICITILPDSHLDGNLLNYHKNSVQNLYKFLWRKRKFEFVDHLYDDNFNDEMSISTNKMLFGDKEVLSKFQEMISYELNFFKTQNVYFNI